MICPNCKKESELKNYCKLCGYLFTDEELKESGMTFNEKITEKSKIKPEIKESNVVLKTASFRSYLIFFTLIILLIVILYSFFNPNKISMSEFEKIRIGMSYNEVIDVIGADGKIVSLNSDDNNLIEAYQFSGNGFFGANAQMMFINGKLTNKAQSGLLL